MPKKHTYGRKIRESNRNQHRNNKDKDFYRTNNASFIGIQQKIKTYLNTDLTHLEIL